MESFSEFVAAPEESLFKNLAAIVLLSAQCVVGVACRHFLASRSILCCGNALFVFGLGEEAPSVRQLIVRSVLFTILEISDCGNVISDTLSFLISVKQLPIVSTHLGGTTLIPSALGGLGCAKGGACAAGGGPLGVGPGRARDSTLGTACPFGCCFLELRLAPCETTCAQVCPSLRGLYTGLSGEASGFLFPQCFSSFSPV